MKGMGLINRGSIIGIKYDMLTPIERISGGKNSSWLCLCECGNKRIFSRANLKSGTVKHCGCRKYIKPEKHGRVNTPEYHTWNGMKARCYNKSIPCYKRYGGRGIRVCDRWLSSFENFYADMGDRPSDKHSLDRYPDNNGNYEPNNCRWATKSEQAIGRRTTIWITYKGRKFYKKELAKYLGVLDSTFCAVVNRRGLSGAITFYEKKLLREK